MNGKNIIVIPARLESTRLPRKAILKESGKYLVQHVYEKACQSKKADLVLVATDSREVMDACMEECISVTLTSVDHQSGTDRVQEAVKDFYFDNIVNLQGDEPLINPEYLDLLFTELEKGKFKYVTLGAPITDDELANPNSVKVYVDSEGKAVDFSRTDFKTKYETCAVMKHVGVYGYTKKALEKFTSLKQTEDEIKERLEQLRLLNNRYTIGVVSVPTSSVGIDTREDYDKFLAFLKKGNHDS